MLPTNHRLSDGPSIGAAVRRGQRAGGRTVVMHLLVRPVVAAAGPGDVGAARVGFVVSRAVGNAVVRNRVKRRLRHLMGDRWSDLPRGVDVVVRALPAAATAESSVLGRDLDRGLNRCLGRGSQVRQS